MSLRKLSIFVYILVSISSLVAAEVQEVCTLSEHTDQINDLQFDRRGQYLASASGDGTIKIWDARHRSPSSIQTLWDPQQRVGVWNVQWSPDTRYIHTSSYDATVQVWDRRSGSAVRTSRYERDLPPRIFWAPDGTKFVAQLIDDSIDVVDVTRNARPTLTIAHGGFIDCSRWDAESRRFAAIDHHNGIHVFTFNRDGSLQSRRMYTVANGIVEHALDWHKDGKLALVSEPLVEGADECLVIPPEDNFLYDTQAVRWNSSGTLLAQAGFDHRAGFDGGVRVYKLNRGRFEADPLRVATNNTKTVAWGKDNMLAFDRGNSIRIVRIVAAARTSIVN